MVHYVPKQPDNVDEQKAMVGHAAAEATGRKEKAATNDVSDRDVVVLGSGNLGLVYLLDADRRFTLEELDGVAPKNPLFVQEGYSVVMAGRRMEVLEKAAQEIGGSPLLATADVTDPTSVKALFSKVKDTFGRLDLLVNNAGIGAPPSVGRPSRSRSATESRSA